jgi:hypothetical protein
LFWASLPKNRAGKPNLKDYDDDDDDDEHLII